MEIQAGAATDALIEEHVFGASWGPREHVGGEYLQHPGGWALARRFRRYDQSGTVYYQHDYLGGRSPAYSTDRSAALQVVDRLIAAGVHVEIRMDAKWSTVEAFVRTGPNTREGLLPPAAAHGEPPASLPLAICRAALDPRVLAYLRSPEAAGTGELPPEPTGERP